MEVDHSGSSWKAISKAHSDTKPILLAFRGHGVRGAPSYLFCPVLAGVSVEVKVQGNLLLLRAVFEAVAEYCLTGQ